RERDRRSWRAANPDPAYLSCLLLLATGIRAGRCAAVRLTAKLHAPVISREQTAHRVRCAAIRATGRRLHPTGNELRHRNPPRQAMVGQPAVLRSGGRLGSPPAV